MTSPTPAQETVDRLKPYVLDLLGTSQRDAAEASKIAAATSEARALTSETNAAGHATQTADDRRQTGEDRTQTGLDRQAAAQSATSASTHEDNSLDAAAAAIAAAVSVAQFQGHGFPNGAVTAPVGSIYTDLDATAGAIRWIKTTGTGNTGWKVEYGDTGWRDITSLITEVTSGTVRVMRNNGIAYLSFTATVFSTTSSGLSISRMVPSGFRIDDTGFTYFPFSSDVSPQPTTLRMDRFGHVYFYNVQGTSASGLFSWPASTWPTVLPGTPA